MPNAAIDVAYQINVAKTVVETIANVAVAKKFSFMIIIYEFCSYRLIIKIF